MAKRLSFINKEELPDSFLEGQPRKNKVQLISQGSHGVATVYPVINSGNSHYLFHRNSLVNEIYGVEINIIEDGEPDIILNTDIAIEFLQEENLPLYSIEQKNIYLNNDHLNNTLYDLAKDCRFAINPLFVTCDDFTVTKFADYKNKWNEIRKEVEQKYQGEFVTNYIKAFEKVLENNNISRSLTEDMFFTLFKYITVNRAFDKKLMSKSILRFPIVSNIGGVIYKIENKLDQYSTDFNCYKISCIGKIADLRTENDFINQSYFSTIKLKDDKIAQGNCTLNFYLNSETGILMFCDAVFNITLNSIKKTVKVKINKI